LSPLAITLVVIGALCHAGWNLIAKKSDADARFTFFSSMWMLVIWTPLALWLSWSVVPKWGAREWLLIAGCGVLKWVYTLALLKGYRKSDLTVVYPVARGSGPLLSSAIAVVVFGETASKQGVFGILSVVAGVFLIAGGPGMFIAAKSAERRARTLAGVRWGALTGALIACYTIADAYVVKIVGISPILLDYWANVARLPISVIPVLRDIPEAKRLWALQWKHAAIVATLAPAGYVCVLYAMTLAPVSYVAPAREVSMLFAAILGGKLLGEEDRFWRIIGAVLVVCGVVALAWKA
jgi:drug/metabolite transporter (DMT)-like permease